MTKQLSQREKLFVTGGAIVLGIVVLVFGLVIPYQSAMARLDRAIATHQAQLQEVRQLRTSYLALQKQAGQLQKDLARSAATTPLTFLEEAAADAAGRDKLVLMRPLPTVVQDTLRIESIEFKLERVDLEQALRLLWEIESARPPMRIDKLYFKQRFDNAAQLDMNATVSAARRN